MDVPGGCKTYASNPPPPLSFCHDHADLLLLRAPSRYSIPYTRNKFPAVPNVLERAKTSAKDMNTNGLVWNEGTGTRSEHRGIYARVRCTYCISSLPVSRPGRDNL